MSRFHREIPSDPWAVSSFYTVTVKHDKGTAKIRVRADSEAKARKRVMDTEGCPACAIVRVTKSNPSAIHDLYDKVEKKKREGLMKAMEPSRVVWLEKNEYRMQATPMYRNMIKALEIHPWQNTTEDWQRYFEAKFILKLRSVKGRKVKKNAGKKMIRTHNAKGPWYVFVTKGTKTYAYLGSVRTKLMNGESEDHYRFAPTEDFYAPLSGGKAKHTKADMHKFRGFPSAKQFCDRMLTIPAIKKTEAVSSKELATYF